MAAPQGQTPIHRGAPRRRLPPDPGYDFRLVDDRMHDPTPVKVRETDVREAEATTDHLDLVDGQFAREAAARPLVGVVCSCIVSTPDEVGRVGFTVR
jgi:hypothetical protein